MYDRIFLKFSSPCFIIKVVSRTVGALLPVKNCCEEILNLSLQLHKFPWKRTIVNCCVKSLRSNDAAPSTVIVVSLDRPKMESSSRKPSCPSFSLNCTKTRRGKSILQLAACSCFSLLTSQKPLFLLFPLHYGFAAGTHNTLK